MNAILTRDLAATNHRPARVVAADADGNRVVVSSVHCPSIQDAHVAAATALARKCGMKGTLIVGETNDGWAFVWFECLQPHMRTTARGVIVVD